MNQDRVQLFDNWAARYDALLQDGGRFPLTGYEQVLDEVVRAAGARAGMKVLDLGVGTGNLSARFAAQGCDLWGIDFSREMLAKARDKLPQATLAQADLLGDWPPEVDQRFDRIVSAYVLHEFDLSAKLDLLQRLAKRHLEAEARIVVGDVSFATREIRDQAHTKWDGQWDEDEYYWAADEAAAACEGAGLQVSYKQISSCGGVFVFEPLASPARG
jgi:putative AdoMet-dependent methyltransferase